MSQWIFSSAAALILAGCATGPRPVSTVALPPTAAAFVTTAPALAADRDLPTHWWHLYNDPVLDRLIERALSENQNLKLASAHLQEAQGLLSEAKAGRFPSSSLSGGPKYDRTRQIGGVKGPGTLDYAATLTAAYQIDLFGRVSHAITAARADAEAVRATRDAVQVTIVAQTASSYATACGFGRQERVANASLALAQQAYDIAKVQSAAGALSNFDLARQGVVLEQTRALVAPLQGQRRAALFALASLIGARPDQVPPDAAACQTPPRLDHPIPVGDGTALLRRRPDLRAAERGLEAAKARIGIARADLYPTITLGGSIGQDTSQNGGVSSAAALTYSVGPLITWSFPNILVARAHIHQAKARAAVAQASFDATVLQSLQEAETALSAYAAELDHEAALRAAGEHADEAAHLAKVQADAGTISYLDLLQAQQTAILADQALTSSQQAVSADQIAVFQALGGGWE